MISYFFLSLFVLSGFFNGVKDFLYFAENAVFFLFKVSDSSFFSLSQGFDNSWNYSKLAQRQLERARTSGCRQLNIQKTRTKKLKKQ